MKNFMKMLTLALALLLTAPVVFAQKDNRVKEQVKDLNSLIGHSDLQSVQDYVRSLEDILEKNENRYEALAEESPLFASLEKIFSELFGEADPFRGTIEEYKVFYQTICKYDGKFAASSFVLPTVAIWVNHSVDGILPYPGQKMAFWENPEQAAKMYNTMAGVDKVDAFEQAKMYFGADLLAEEPTFPKVEVTPDAILYAHDFFNKFAQAGSFAQQDADELEEFTEEQIYNRVHETLENEQQISPEIEARVKAAFHVK